MTNTRAPTIIVVLALAAIAAVQASQTPEQREAAARQRYEKGAASPPPVG